MTILLVKFTPAIISISGNVCIEKDAASEPPEITLEVGRAKGRAHPSKFSLTFHSILV